MRSSLLSRFRGVDGHSLARALALLIVVNAVVAGLHTGVTAAEPAQAICSVGAESAGGDVPDAGHPGGATDRLCCTFGCVPTGAALPTADATVMPSPALRGIKAPPPREGILAATGWLPSHRPRGPPVLA
jgi:hypothetical protein